MAAVQGMIHPKSKASSIRHLLFGNQIVSGGGNAMVQTLALMKAPEEESKIINVFSGIDDGRIWVNGDVSSCDPPSLLPGRTIRS
jgi:hypothetical protein